MCSSDEICAGEGECILSDSDWGLTPISDDGVDASASDAFDQVDMGDVSVEEMGTDLPSWPDYSVAPDVLIPTRVRGGCVQSTQHGSHPYSTLIMGVICLLCMRRKYEF